MNDMPKTKLKSTSRLLVLLMAFCMLATVITTVLVSTSTKADGATISVNSAGAFTNALSSSANGDTIRLTGNFSMGTTTTSISGSKTVTLNLNGYTITWVNNNQGSKDRDAFLGPVLTVNSGVTLIVTDSSSGGAGGLSVSATARCTAVKTGARTVRARAYLIANYGTSD